MQWRSSELTMYSVGGTTTAHLRIAQITVGLYSLLDRDVRFRFDLKIVLFRVPAVIAP